MDGLDAENTHQRGGPCRERRAGTPPPCVPRCFQDKVMLTFAHLGGEYMGLCYNIICFAFFSFFFFAKIKILKASTKFFKKAKPARAQPLSPVQSFPQSTKLFTQLPTGPLHVNSSHPGT